MRRLLVAAFFVAFAGCAQQQPQQGGAAMSIKVESSAFKAGAAIPAKYTGEGPDVSPALAWSGVPAGAKELALICDDPDAPRAQPWVHWVIYGLPPTTAGLPENVAKDKTLKQPEGAVQGLTDFDKIGYNGPMPPRGHGTHHYHFMLYALDANLKLAPGLTKADLLKAMKGHILAQGEVVGTYERK
jgi:Raf kinase inhibitor-like YbhB/YbcL family protein